MSQTELPVLILLIETGNCLHFIEGDGKCPPFSVDVLGGDTLTVCLVSFVAVVLRKGSIRPDSIADLVEPAYAFHVEFELPFEPYILESFCSVGSCSLLYAGACVLKGAWLGYPQLEDMGIELESFRDFAAVPALVARAMDGALTGLAPDQRALFPRLYSWEAVRDSWLSLYR